MKSDVIQVFSHICMAWASVTSAIPRGPASAGVCNEAGAPHSVAAPPAQGAQIAAQAHLSMYRGMQNKGCCRTPKFVVRGPMLRTLWRLRQRKAHPLTLQDGTRKHAHPPNRCARGRSPARPTNSL